MTKECVGWLGRRFGHRFDTTVVLGPLDLSMFSDVKIAPGCVDALRPVLKVVTVCRRCGAKAEEKEND